MLMSATSNAEVERLQKLVLQNPVTLNLLRPDQDDARSGGAAAGPGSAAEIEHFSVHCDRCGGQASHVRPSGDIVTNDTSALWNIKRGFAH